MKFLFPLLFINFLSSPSFALNLLSLTEILSTASAPKFLVALRTSKAHVAVFRESLVKEGTEFKLKKEKVCESMETVNVYDLTAGPNPDYKAVWKEFCRTEANGITATVSWSSDIFINHQDLFMDGNTLVYRSLFLNFGFGEVGGPYSILGSNSTYDQDLTLGKKISLQVQGQGSKIEDQKLSMVIEVED